MVSSGVQYVLLLCITGNGNSVRALALDLCPSCEYGMLDVSPAVFRALFGDLGLGIGRIEWDFCDGNTESAADRERDEREARESVSLPIVNSTIIPVETIENDNITHFNNTIITPDQRKGCSVVYKSNMAGPSVDDFIKTISMNE